MPDREAQLERLAQHPAHDAAPPRCEVVADDGYGRCKGKVVAVRWVFGFADFVCEPHAESARRGMNDALEFLRAIALDPIRDEA